MMIQRNNSYMIPFWHFSHDFYFFTFFSSRKLCKKVNVFFSMLLSVNLDGDKKWIWMCWIVMENGNVEWNAKNEWFLKKSNNQFLNRLTYSHVWIIVINCTFPMKVYEFFVNFSVKLMIEKRSTSIFYTLNLV